MQCNTIQYVQFSVAWHSYNRWSCLATKYFSFELKSSSRCSQIDFDIVSYSMTRYILFTKREEKLSEKRVERHDKIFRNIYTYEYRLNFYSRISIDRQVMWKWWIKTGNFSHWIATWAIFFRRFLKYPSQWKTISASNSSKFSIHWFWTVHWHLNIWLYWIAQTDFFVCCSIVFIHMFN